MRTETVATLMHKANELLANVAKSQKPTLITQRGLPLAYLVDVESYDSLCRRMAILEGIVRGEGAIEHGRTLTQAEAESKMARWLQI